MEDKNNLIILVDNVYKQFDVNTFINIGVAFIVTSIVYKFVTSDRRQERADWKSGFLYGLVAAGILWVSINQWMRSYNVNTHEELSVLTNIIGWSISAAVIAGLCWFFLKETNFDNRRLISKILVGIVAAISAYIAIGVVLIGSGSLAISISLGCTFGSFFMMSLMTISGYLRSNERGQRDAAQSKNRRVEL